jgi:predicted metalloprotease with PDZ domain
MQTRWIVSAALVAATAVGATRQLEPVAYTVRAPAPDTHVAEIEAVVPTENRAAIELMLPNWSPGYYSVGDYARNVQALVARSLEGTPLSVDRPAANRWRIHTAGAARVTITYRLLCESRFVTGCWIGVDSAVLNGPATFITLAEQARRPHRVRLVLPPAWKDTATSLDPGSLPHEYSGTDYDTFADSPIVAGTISVHEFDVPGTRLILADFGELGTWDGGQAVAMLKPIVDEHRRMIGGLPFKRYVFLNAFRSGAGGLEHLNSSLLSSAPNPQSPTPTLRWLKYVSHEFFHAINVKRLRPIELGPFDYDNVPRTPSLWLSEGVTTYYGDLAVVRSGIGTRDDFLSGMSSRIRQLQRSPGRLMQTLEQASLEVGRGRGSGVGGNPATTVSYYVKGCIVGLLLDARIRHVTSDRSSFDDVMRLAYRRYGGERGFTPEEFQATASEVAGVDLSDFFRRSLVTTEELDYGELLDWYGLRFAATEPPDPARAWTLEVRSDSTAAQRQHLERLLAPTPSRPIDARNFGNPAAHPARR